MVRTVQRRPRCLALIASIISIEVKVKVKSSQVANFQIGTNKCAMQRAQPSEKRKYAASGALIEAEVAWNSSDIRHRLD